MSRPRKIALLGAQGYDFQSADTKVICFSWDNLRDITNLRDFDTVILTVLSIPKSVDWNLFTKILNVNVMHDIVKADGRIYVVGDPRFKIVGKNLDEPFLAWTGVAFTWDDQPGDTVHLSDEWRHKPLRAYLSNLKRWDYALRQCTLDRKGLSPEIDLVSLEKVGLRTVLKKERYAWNRYNEDLAFSVRVVLERHTDDFQPGWNEFVRLGTITVLPKTSLNADETILTVLREICEVEAGLPEPDWVHDYNAPGQDLVDADINSIKRRIEVANQELQGATEKRVAVRQCLKLLYERGQPLEVAVRDILRSLGGQVEDPEEAGKEDGWLTVTIDGGTHEGVLEIKSTKNQEFDEYGLKQLLDWVYRGVQLRGKKYKGIFIGSNLVGEPPEKRQPGFSDSWKKSSTLHSIVAMKTEDLYRLYLLNVEDKLDLKQFWDRLFNTAGLFDVSEFIQSK